MEIINDKNAIVVLNKIDLDVNSVTKETTETLNKPIIVKISALEKYRH